MWVLWLVGWQVARVVKYFGLCLMLVMMAYIPLALMLQ